MTSPPDSGNAQRSFLILGTVVLAIAALYWAQRVLIPVALAILFAFILTPAVLFFQRHGLKRVLAVLLVTLLAFTLLGGLVVGLTVEVHDLSLEILNHKANILHKLEDLQGSGPGIFSDIFTMFKDISEAMAKATGSAEANPANVRKVEVVNLKPGGGMEWIPTVARPLLEVLADAGLVVMLVIFMLLRREDLRNRLLRLIGHGRLTVTTRALDDAGTRISRYLLMQLSINSGLGAAVIVGLWFLGVPYAFLWGFLTAILRFVPYIGSWLSMLLPMTISVAISQGWFQPVAILVLYAVLELTTANVIEPLLFSHSTGISSVALLVSAAFWTWLWGPIGLVMSTPLSVCLGVLGRYVPPLHFFDVLLGDEEVLDAKVRYYQRLLARDQDEATELVEEYLADHSYQTVYDEVLLPALLWAKRDRERGDLPPDDQQFIYRVTRDILEDTVAPLQEISLIAVKGIPGDGEAAPDQARVLVLGCPARDEADEAALAMLAQMLRATSCRVEVLGAQVLTAEVLGRVQQDRPGIVCIGALPPGGLAQARYLCKRLRAQFPDLKILVGRWGLTESVERMQKRLVAAGADAVATSLRETFVQLAPLVQELALTQAGPAAVPINNRSGEPSRTAG